MTYDGSTLQSHESNMQLVETTLQILDFDLSLVSGV
jgi:hypothetical protein